MKMKKLFAVMAATAISAASLATMGLNSYAADIPYTGPTAGVLATDNDGVSLRVNILNTWGNDFRDIDENTSVVDYIKVNFTVSGIGTNSCNHNEDGTDGDPYVAFIAGGIGTNAQVWKANDGGSAGTAITGDGTYECTWTLAEDSESISCLILQTNINFFNYGTSIADSGVNIKINSISTGPDQQTTTEAPTNSSTNSTTNNNNSSATTTAASNNNSSKTTTTTTSKSGSSNSTTTKKNSSSDNSATTTTTKAASNGGKNETSANTGDAGVGLAITALSVAGLTAIVSRKRK